MQKARKNYAPKQTRELKTELTPSSKQKTRPKRAAILGPNNSNVLSKNAFLVNINGKSIKLPLPDNFGNITVNSGMWYLPRDDKYIPAEFLNRETILLQLLNAAYDNIASTKPKYAMQIMGKGSGKTRLLVEWICQALNNESVLHSFLNEKGTVVTDVTLTKDDLTSAAKKTRRQFINSLVDTVYRQRIILYTGTVLEDFLPTDLNANVNAYSSKFQNCFKTLMSQFSLVLANFIRTNIEARFKNKTIVHQGQQIKITKEWFDSNKEMPHIIYTEYLRLFNSLIDQQELPDSVLPFPEDGLHSKRTVVLGIDECQVSTVNAEILSLSNTLSAGLQSPHKNR